jgi:toxin ParE1/3/4
MKLFVKASARKDLRDIATYIARDNPQRAVSFIQELNETIRHVAERPLIFAVRDEWGGDRRSALHGNYHIIFEASNDTVTVLRVLHGARNIPDIL